MKNRLSMFVYDREDYLFVKKLQDRLIKYETKQANERLAEKIQTLFINQIPSSTREPLDEGKNVSKDNAEEVEYNVLTEPKIRRLINLTQYAKQPPKMDTDSKRRAQEVKSNIMQAYKQYQWSK